jgi:hypothetical protein
MQEPKARARCRRNGEESRGEHIITLMPSFGLDVQVYAKNRLMARDRELFL